jgi:hypothetical protein
MAQPLFTYDASLRYVYLSTFWHTAIALKKPSVLDCASNFAAKTSIAGGLHSLGIGNNGGLGGFATRDTSRNGVLCTLTTAADR